MFVSKPSHFWQYLYTFSMVACSDRCGRRAVRASEFTIVCAILDGIIVGSKLRQLPFELRCRWLTVGGVGVMFARRRSARAHASKLSNPKTRQAARPLMSSISNTAVGRNANRALRQWHPKTLPSDSFSLVPSFAQNTPRYSPQPLHNISCSFVVTSQARQPQPAYY